MTSPQHQVPSPSWHTTLSRASTPSWTSCKSCENRGSDIVGGMIATGDLQTAHQYGVSSAAMGASLGAVSGAIGGYMSAQKQGISPWTGKAIDPQPSIVLGRDMNNRVNPVAKDLGAKTISKEWDANFGSRDVHHNEGLSFNKQWLEFQIEQNVKIYDLGTGKVRNTSNYYNMEQQVIQLNNYPVQHIYYMHLGTTIRVVFLKSF